MKKLMIALAAVACAAGVQAASVTWSGLAGTPSTTQADASKYSIYLIDAACYDQATAIADLQAGGLNFDSGDVLRQTEGIPVAANNTFRWSETQQAQTGGDKTYVKTDKVSAYAIIFNDAKDKATQAMITKVIANAEVNDSGLVSFSFGSMATSGAVAQSWTAVPEPTSGLLLLLGVAGLALKRRRA